MHLLSFTLLALLLTVTQIDNVTPEWQFLFDQSGVTREMLEDRGTLQFILDTVYKLGGAPQKLNLAQEESMCYSKRNVY